MTEELEREVAGEYNTFRVYLYVLRKKEARVRDVQRDLGFSSPHLAAHHLEKLNGLGLVEKENLHYRVVPKSFGVLRLFFVLDRWVLPKTLFLAIIFLTMTVGFLILLQEHPYFQAALLLSVVGLAVSVYLTVQFIGCCRKRSVYNLLYSLYKKMIYILDVVDRDSGVDVVDV